MTTSAFTTTVPEPTQRFITAECWQRPALASANTSAADVESIVENMLQHIASEGDAAIERYALSLDGIAPKPITLLPFADYELAPDVRAALQLAADRIRRFAERQLASVGPCSFSDDYGEYAHVVRPLERIAAYIPAGRYPLLSSALMTLIPAQVAGVKERIALSISEHPAVLAAASLAGATHYWQIGGAQAIAAAAFGYRQLTPVEMIVGPGNAYVACAKTKLQNRVRIDTDAGPSELLAICDRASNIAYLAFDALAQCEHDPNAYAVIVGREQTWLEQLESVLRQYEDGARALATQQIQLVLAETSREAIALANRMAPEHLMLCDAQIDPDHLTHYGALFIGQDSAVALGDYLSGPNHTLPTMGSARRSSGLSALSFLRWQTRQKIKTGSSELYAQAQVLAAAEGLHYHAASLQIRG